MTSEVAETDIQVNYAQYSTKLDGGLTNFSCDIIDIIDIPHIMIYQQNSLQLAHILKLIFVKENCCRLPNFSVVCS